MNSPKSFRSRVILLGASNLTMAFPLLVSELRRRLEPPIQIFSVHGHGRSYGQWSYVLFYGLPGISGCALWKQLRECSPAENTFALATDIGNDLIYGTEPDRLLTWVDEVLSRLGPDCRTVLTRLPIDSALSVGPIRYHITRQVFFPGPVIPWPVMQDRARTVDEALVSLGSQRSLLVHQFAPHDFGFDRIHLRFTSQLQAWQGVFEKWGLVNGSDLQPSNWGDRRRLWSCFPHEYRLHRKSLTSSQPCLGWPDGSELWMF